MRKGYLTTSKGIEPILIIKENIIVRGKYYTIIVRRGGVKEMKPTILVSTKIIKYKM